MKYLWLIGLLLSSVTTVYAQSGSADFNINFLVGGDTTAPSTPVLLQANPVSVNQVDLNWTASTDNYFLQGYVISRGTSTIATTSATAFSDTSVSASSTYTYSVQAFDAVGNYSTSSNSITVTTPDYPVVQPPGAADGGTIQANIARIVARDITVTPDFNEAKLAVELARPARLTIRWGRSSDYELGYSVSEYYSDTHVRTLTDLEPGTVYEYEITAQMSFGLESVIEAGQFTTLAASGSGIPANVSRFFAATDNTDVQLSWQVPQADDVAFVRIVRSHFGFPQYPQNGAVVYQGKDANFTDVDILREYSPVYYTAFVYNPDGKVSSGAVAMAFAEAGSGSTGDSDSGATTPEPITPPTKVPEATSTIDQTQVTPDMRLPELSDIQIVQGQRGYTWIGPRIPLLAEQSFVVRIPVAAVAGNLKSIIGTLLDPTDNELSYSFLLRNNENRTYYEAVVPRIMVTGESVLQLQIYDYEALTVATYKVPVQFSQPDSAQSTVLFPDIFFRDPWRLLLPGAGVIIAALVLWAILRRGHEDKV